VNRGAGQKCPTAVDFADGGVAVVDEIGGVSARRRRRPQAVRGIGIRLTVERCQVAKRVVRGGAADDSRGIASRGVVGACVLVLAVERERLELPTLS
jgi:hypothetical protein